jgi:tetratricopeptide (TPR) repeat protein
MTADQPIASATEEKGGGKPGLRAIILAHSVLTVFGWVVVFAACAVLCVKVMSMPLHYDEWIHAHYLWLVSIGQIPHKDFFCTYSALCYMALAPGLRLFPESIYVVFDLRFLGLAVVLSGMMTAFYIHSRTLGVKWPFILLPAALIIQTPMVCMTLAQFRPDAYAAAAAMWALALMFKQATALRSGWMAALTALSILIMPKYIVVLALGNLVYFGRLLLEPRRNLRAIITAIVAGTIVLLLSAGLLWMRGVRLWDDVYWSMIIMSKYWSHCAKTGGLDPDYLTNSDKTWYWEYFLDNWSMALVLLLGMVGWFAIVLKKRGIEFWLGIALAAGTVISWLISPFAYPQNYVPGLLCLMFFTPYMAFLFKRPVTELLAVSLLLALSLQAVVVSGRKTIDELSSKVAVKDFADRQKLLGLIPRAERVVGMNWSHPCFRIDQTFVAFDEHYGNPWGFGPVIPKDSEVWGFFQPEYFAESLNRSPPASIAIDDALDAHNFPPGWNDVLLAFLIRNKDNYEIVSFPSGHPLFIRRDVFAGNLQKAAANFPGDWQPGDAKANVKFGAALARIGRIDGAIAQYRKALEIDPSCAAAYNNLGDALVSQGQIKEAAAAFEQALAIDSKLAPAWNNLAGVLSKSGRLREAVAGYRRAIELDARFAEAHKNLALILDDLGHHTEATQQLRTALEIKPDYAEAHNSLGAILMEQGALADAIAHFRRAIAINPKFDLPHANLGRALSRQRHYAAAAAEFRTFLRLQPNHPVVLGWLAWLLATAPEDSVRDGKEAVALAEKAAATGRPESLDALAAAYAECRRFPEAVAAARKAKKAAEDGKNQSLAAAIAARLKLYEAGKPYRDDR